jgi:hypothetical protein
MRTVRWLWKQSCGDRARCAGRCHAEHPPSGDLQLFRHDGLPFTGEFVTIAMLARP